MTNIESTVMQAAANPTLSQGEIAVIAGCTQQAVSKILRKDEIKARVEALQARAIDELMEPAYDNVRHMIQAYRSKDSDVQLRDHGHKASMAMMQGIGILPSHATSVVINNLFLTGPTASQVPPEVQELLSLRSQSDPVEAIDAEYEDI
jgi:predicted transcriptional regulator